MLLDGSLEVDKNADKRAIKAFVIGMNFFFANTAKKETPSANIYSIIGTTKAIESYNGQLRKVTKFRSIFPNDESLLKMLYLATHDITKKWTQNMRNWTLVLVQLSIHFNGRIDID